MAGLDCPNSPLYFVQIFHTFQAIKMFLGLYCKKRKEERKKGRKGGMEGWRKGWREGGTKRNKNKINKTPSKEFALKPLQEHFVTTRDYYFKESQRIRPVN